jgi:hypothetical protein
MPNSPHPDRLDPIQNLEPAAQAGASHLGGSAVAASLSITAQVSIAISLKRIADALTGGEGQLNAHFLERAAYQAGVAFEQGRR